jgi:hypothetical protein
VEGSKYEGDWIEDQQVLNPFLYVSTVLGLKYGQIKPSILVSISKGRRRAKESLFGVMVLLTKVISRIITKMAKVSMCGLMVEFTMVNG